MKDDLQLLADWLAAGALTPVVETYPLADVAAAFAELGEGHCRAKVVVTP